MEITDNPQRAFVPVPIAATRIARSAASARSPSNNIPGPPAHYGATPPSARRQRACDREWRERRPPCGLLRGFRAPALPPPLPWFRRPTSAPSRLSGSLSTPFVSRPTAIRKSRRCEARGRVSVLPLTSVSLVVPQRAIPSIVAQQRADHALAVVPILAVGAELAPRGLASSVRTPICIERPSVRAIRFRSETRGSFCRATGFSSDLDFAPRPRRMERSSVPIGRTAGSGDRQRWSATLTSALIAGRGIDPSSAGGLARYAFTSVAYSAWSSPPVRVLSGEQLVQHQPAREHVGESESRH